MRTARQPDRVALGAQPDRAVRIADQTFAEQEDTPRCKNCGQRIPDDQTHCSRDCEESAPGSYLG